MKTENNYDVINEHLNNTFKMGKFFKNNNDKNKIL